MAADEPQTRRQSPRRLEDFATWCCSTSVTTADPGDVVGQASRRIAMFWRTGAARTIRSASRHHAEIVAADVGGVHPHRGLEHMLAIDRHDQRARPALLTASAIDPPISPNADDGDALEERRISGRARLDDWRVSASNGCRSARIPASVRRFRAIPSRASSEFRSPSSAFIRPIRAARPARGRCCGRSPAR